MGKPFVVRSVSDITPEEWAAMPPPLWECERCEAEAVGEDVPAGWRIIRESLHGIELLCPACAMAGED